MAVPILGTSAVAADGDEQPITWSVSPADGSGPDGRAWAELTLDPGESIVDHLAVRNLSSRAVTFAISAADGYFTPTGRFNMLPSDAESTDAGLWIDVQSTVEVGPDETVVIPFTVTVPDNATPGDHAAGIAASVFAESTGDGQVGVESRVGFRVLTRVTGDIVSSATIEGVRAEYQMSWNPFAPGKLVVTFEATNDGNVRTAVTGQVSGGGRSATFGVEDERRTGELLPGDRREMTVVLDDVWPQFLVTAAIAADIEVPGTDDAWTPVAGEGVAESVTAWAVPWSALIVLVAGLLMVGPLVLRRRHRKAGVEALIAEARDQGRQEGLTLAHREEAE